MPENSIFMKCNNMIMHESGELYTRGVNIGCAVVDDAKSSCCKLWIRVHLS